MNWFTQVDTGEIIKRSVARPGLIDGALPGSRHFVMNASQNNNAQQVAIRKEERAAERIAQLLVHLRCNRVPLEAQQIIQAGFSRHFVRDDLLHLVRSNKVTSKAIVIRGHTRSVYWAL